MEQDIAASFSAKLLSLHPMLQWVDTHLKASGLSDIEIGKIELALEETLVNIISYAYENDTGMIELECHLEPEAFIEITIKDRGHPFNPLQYKIKNHSVTSLEEKEEGGLGILLIKNLVSKVEYTRFQNINILKLTKILKQ